MGVTSQHVRMSYISGAFDQTQQLISRCMRMRSNQRWVFLLSLLHPRGSLLSIRNGISYWTCCTLTSL